MTILVKSITTPLAMDAAGAIGGIPSLAAIFVIITGIVGAICGPALFRLMGVHNQAAQGTALGAVSHAIGTARAISISEQCTAFATLALCVNGIEFYQEGFACDDERNTLRDLVNFSDVGARKVCPDISAQVERLSIEVTFHLCYPAAPVACRYCVASHEVSLFPASILCKV